VVVPWRREITYQEMGIGGKYPRQDPLNNKGDMRCHPRDLTDIQISSRPARLCTEQEASVWLKPGSDPWYFAQGLELPAEDEKKPGKTVAKGNFLHHPGVCSENCADTYRHLAIPLFINQ